MATILVIDDKPTNRDVLRTVLRYKHHRVLEACDGEEGLERALAQRPDLIIADILMPKMDGYEMVHRLRREPALANVKVVFYTATYLRAEGLRLASECGVKHMIIKPSEPQDILDTVETALREDSRPMAPALDESFDREHLRLVSDKLLQKVVELEDTNHRLIEEAGQRVRAEEALRASEARLRGILDAALDSIITVDAEGKVVEMNPAAEHAFGYRRDEIEGRPLTQLILPLPSPDKNSGDVQYFTSGNERFPLGKRVEMTALRADGSEFPVELTVMRVWARGPLLFTAYIREITEQKAQEKMRRRGRELEEENRLVQEANRLKSEFLANMSHELRTPLNAIIGFSELMVDGRVGPVSSEHKEYLSDILAGGHHLLQLINDVLDLSKIEAGKMPLVLRPVNLTEVVAEVRAIVQGLSAQKKIHLDFDIEPALTEIVADARSLKQVLYNYLSNAIKFTAEGGRVVLRMRAEPPDRVRIEVEDTGIGIGAGDIGKLFSEFQQLDEGRSKQYQGTGLGLALTKRLVEAHGGEVGVSSEVGKGSVFWAVLPKNGARSS